MKTGPGPRAGPSPSCSSPGMETPPASPPGLLRLVAAGRPGTAREKKRVLPRPGSLHHAVVDNSA